MTEEEYFDKIHTDNKETLYNALKRIEELELELTVEKDQHQEEINLHLHAEEYIKSLEKQIEKIKTDLNNAIESASKWYVSDPVCSMLVDIYNDNFEITKGVSN